jgi:hypothetical protein
MATTVKKTNAIPKESPTVDARSRIKPRGLRGMFKGRIILNGTDEEVFGLTLTTNVG